MLYPIAPIISKIQKMPILQPKLIKMRERTTSNQLSQTITQQTSNCVILKNNQYP